MDGIASNPIVRSSRIDSFRSNLTGESQSNYLPITFPATSHRVIPVDLIRIDNMSGNGRRPGVGIAPLCALLTPQAESQVRTTSQWALVQAPQSNRLAAHLVISMVDYSAALVLDSQGGRRSPLYQLDTADFAERYGQSFRDFISRYHPRPPLSLLESHQASTYQRLNSLPNGITVQQTNTTQHLLEKRHLLGTLHIPLLQNAPPKKVNFPENSSIAQFFNHLSVYVGETGAANPTQFFKNIKTNCAPEHRKFQINFAVMRHFLSQVPEENFPVRNALIVRAMNYLREFAPFERPESWQWQVSPTQSPSDKYARLGNLTTNNFEANLARTLGIPNANVFLTTDQEVKHVLAGALPFHQGGNVSVWREGKNSATDNEDPNPHIAAILSAVESHKGQKPLLLDISSSLAQMPLGLDKTPGDVGLSIKTIQTFLHDTLEAGITQIVTDQRQQNGITEQGIKQEVRRRMQEIGKGVVVIGTFHVGAQAVLYAGPLESVTDARDERIKPQTLPILHSGQRSTLMSLNRRNGFSPIHLQAVENWAQATAGEIDPILKEFSNWKELPITFPEVGSQLFSFENVSAFLNHPVVHSFHALSENASAPYLDIFPRTTVKLLKGLQKISLDQSFKDNKLGSLLQFIYNRIIVEMEVAIVQKDHFIPFIDQVHLIHEELATLLTISSPYRKHDFNTIMQRVSNYLPPNFPKEIKQDFYLKNAGMRCLQAVIDGCRKAKDNAGNTATATEAGLNIAFQKGIYPESGWIMNQSRLDNCREYDGTRTDAASALDMPHMLKGDQKIDLFVAEIHHNASKQAERYKTEDLIAQVDGLYEKGMCSDNFTVAIDHTIGVTDSFEVQEFLSHNADRIQRGALNVVIYRSAQKFDLLGMDNYNGGIMAVINKEQAFAAFDKAVSHDNDNLSKSSLQGITHLQTAQDELNDYRQRIMCAAVRMSSSNDAIGFPDQLLASSNNPNPIQLIPNHEDWKNGFLHFKFGPDLDPKVLIKQFKNMAQEDPDAMPIGAREGFGFPQTNLMKFGGSHLRLTPGLEGDTALKNYRDHLVCWNKIIQTAQDNCDGPAKWRTAAGARALEYGLPLVKLLLAIDRGEKNINDQATCNQLVMAYEEVGDRQSANLYRGIRPYRVDQDC